MKKILILSFSLFLATLVYAFAQTYTESEEYKEGVQYYDEANVEQTEGQYNNSYDLSQLALGKLDLVLADISSALFEAYKKNAAAAKSEADASISKAKSVGASVNEASIAYDNASKSETLIGTFEDDTSSVQAKIDAANKIMSELPSGAQNNLDLAKKKHEGLLSSNVITSGDDTDTQVSTLLADAQTLIDNSDNAGAQAKIDSANKAMADASGQKGLVATRSELSEAKVRQNNLLSLEDIAEGDDTDKQVTALLAEAEKLLGEADTALSQESTNYKNTIDGYTESSRLATVAHDAYIKEKTAETQKLISDATTKYNALLKSGIIQKGDSNDTSVSAAIAKANADLKNNDFASAQSGINAIMGTMAAAERDNASKVAAAQSALDAAKAKYDGLLASGVITKGDDYDKKISAALSAAASSIAKNDFAASSSSVAEANSLMAEAESNKQKESANTKSDLDAAKAKHQALLASGAITKGDDTDTQISDLLSEAEKLLAAGDTAGAKAKIDSANKIMSDLTSSTQDNLDAAKARHEALLASGSISKGDDIDKQISDLLAEAERLLAEGDIAGAQAKIDSANKLLDAASSAGLDAITAGILDQLRKIRDMVRELVESGKIDVNGPEVARINAIISRMIDLLSSGELTGENLERAQENLTELVETVDEVVSSVNAAESAGGRRVVGTLPKYYIVRNGDSLWAIARYSFVYGNSIHWEVLYNANADSLYDRDNPHVILPNQVIEIPSLEGETREGTYSPDIEYIVE